MIKPIISIRRKQLVRALNGVGLFRVVFLLILLCAILYGVFMQLHDIVISNYIFAGFISLIVAIHLRRADKDFLKTYFEKYKLIYFVEYFILSLPLIVCLVYYQHWLQTVVLLIALAFAVNVEFEIKQRSLNTKIQRLIPSNCFEWKSGVRKSLFVIIILWVIGIAFSFFVGSIPIVIFSLGLIPMGFYEIGEPIRMLFAKEIGTNKFLLHKIKMQLILFTVLILPLILIFLVFHYEYWYIPILEYFILIFVHIFTILTKYAFYEPDQKSSAAQVFSIIGMLSIIFFVMIPIVWILSIYLYFKSKEKLNFYLNDYN